MMKRIAALTALVITLLAVPAAAAMATTGGPGPGPGYAKTGPVHLVCPRTSTAPAFGIKNVPKHFQGQPIGLITHGQPSMSRTPNCDSLISPSASAPRLRPCSRNIGRGPP